MIMSILTASWPSRVKDNKAGNSGFLSYNRILGSFRH